MLLRPAKAKWWIFKTQTMVVFTESILEKSQNDPCRDRGNARDSNATAFRRPDLLSSMVVSKALFFLLGNLPSVGFGMELVQESESKGVGGLWKSSSFSFSLVCRDSWL